MFAKIIKHIILAKQAHFLMFRNNKKPAAVVFDEKTKNGIGLKIGQPQQKCQRRPTLQPIANPTVEIFLFETTSQKTN